MEILYDSRTGEILRIGADVEAAELVQCEGPTAAGWLNLPNVPVLRSFEEAWVGPVHLPTATGRRADWEQYLVKRADRRKADGVRWSESDPRDFEGGWAS